MHRNKDVILGEDGYTNRSDNAPRNIFSLIGFALKILKSVSPSPTRAIEQFQDDRNKALRLFSGDPPAFLLNRPVRTSSDARGARFSKFCRADPPNPRRYRCARNRGANRARSHTA